MPAFAPCCEDSDEVIRMWQYLIITKMAMHRTLSLLSRTELNEV